ncbi:ABC transporter permease [Halobacterium zhouii]|uniref:ABC transporter permease n=1 Tax=Halobacterium zhouii TaxID=2902624 RepID=UPI001E58BF13|nr:ABC transporter permease [Halobacterium zhouii]
MPSTRLNDATFLEVDWTEIEDGHRISRRTVGFALALLAVAALFVYDHVFVTGAIVGTWDVTRVDWLFGVSLVVCARYVGVPLATNWDRTKRYAARIADDPFAASAFVFFGVFFVVALVGPEVYGMALSDLSREYQPPVFAAVDASAYSHYDCIGRLANGYCHGSWEYPLGTTSMGEPVLEMLVYGMRTILEVALSVTVIMGVVATAVGTTAGYLGGWVDDVLMGYVDVQQTIPAVVVYLVVATMVLRDKSVFVLAIFFGLLDWGGIARLVRSETLKRRSSGYVRAARASGASDYHVIRRHLVPNATATLSTSLSRRIPVLILTQVGLAFLMLTGTTMRSLGEMIRRGIHTTNWLHHWWTSATAVVFIVLVVLACNVVGDALRDALDPKGS